MKGNKVNEVLNRLHLAMPNKRDDKVWWSLQGAFTTGLWHVPSSSSLGSSGTHMHMDFMSGLEFLAQTDMCHVCQKGEP